MKNKLLKKFIALTITAMTLCALPVMGVSASWKSDSTGWWYTEGSSWTTGWKQIDGKWYYFYSSGYMAKNTTIDGCQLGSDGAWIQNNAQTVNTYSAGQKWIVDGQWEFTINSVTTTKDRNQFSKQKPAQVLIIDYSYKNLGYVSNIQDLYFSMFTVMDEKGEVAELYPATISNYPKPTPIGGTCSNAMVAYGVKNESSSITIQVEQYKSGYTEKEKATFKIPVE